MSEAITREEKLLDAIATGETPDIKPITRKEKYLRYLAGVGEKPEKPITREEMFLDKIQAGGSGGGGTGGGDTGSQLDALIDGSITEVTSNATTVRKYAFYSNSMLRAINCPMATTIYEQAFYNCNNLTTVVFPLVTRIEKSAFYNNSMLTAIKFPLVTKLMSGAFYGCVLLTIADFPILTQMASDVFYSCHSLKAVILRGETLCSLSSKSVFTYCYHILGTTNATYNPNGDKDGYFYVPRALVDTYKSATNWSTYASQFRALEDYTVDGTITGELDTTKI
jgi:hypothetical protein